MTEITRLVNKNLNPFDSFEKMKNVQDFFLKYNFSHFPVIEQETFLGCIDSEDAKTFESEKIITDYRYALDFFFVRDNTLWLDILGNFAKNHTSIMPVLDHLDRYLGYYKILDFTKIFNSTPFLQEYGDILIVEKETEGYTMSQITQIVESNNSKLLGLFISDMTPEKTQIILKVNLGSMNEIIQAFRRFNYEIISEHLEDTYIQNLKNRSEYLDKYLNI